MSFDWFPWYPLAFRQKTYGLTLEEDGAYRRLIDEYMITQKPLPSDPTALARILGGISAEECNRIFPRVMRFFTMRNNKLYNKRCEDELRVQAARRLRNSERAKKAAHARHTARHTKAVFNNPSGINDLDAASQLALCTRQDKEKKLTSLSSENSAARAREDAPVLQEQMPMEITETVGSLATALLDGALTRQPDAGASEKKRIDQLSRAELEASFARKRSANGKGKPLE